MEGRSIEMDPPHIFVADVANETQKLGRVAYPELGMYDLVPLQLLALPRTLSVLPYLGGVSRGAGGLRLGGTTSGMGCWHVQS